MEEYAVKHCVEHRGVPGTALARQGSCQPRPHPNTPLAVEGGRRGGIPAGSASAAPHQHALSPM